MELSILDELRARWQSCRAGLDVPTRSAIEERGLGPAEDCAFIVECKAAGQARFRRAGGLVRDLMGMEVRGMKVDAIFDPAFRGDAATVLGAVLDGPAMAELGLVSPGSPATTELKARMVLLPLRGRNGAIEWILGALATDGPIGRPPRRFGITGKILTAIPGKRRESTSRPTYDLPEAAHRADGGFAEPPAGFEGPKDKSPARQRGHLRLIVSRD